MDDKGTVILEFSIILPILFLCIWGILALALYVIESQMLHFAAYTAARVAILDTDEAGLDSAAGFLVASRGELSWASEDLRGITGRKLSVNRRGRRVDVEIGRDSDLLSKLTNFLVGRGRSSALIVDLAKTFRHQEVFYSMGRSR